LLELALTHRSFSYEAGGIPTNERLEFLGDSVLGLVVTDELSILADSLEALVGAIYLQYDYTKTAEIVLKWMQPSLSSVSTLGAALDGKTALQEIAATLNLSAPEYEITESGPDHDKSFVAIAIVGGEKFPSGEGKSKREAEQSAAKLAHEVLSSRVNKK